MSSLYLWIPKDFDKRYEKYRSKFVQRETPKPSILDNLAKEKKNLLAIKDEREYQDEMDKWKPVNMIVNEIYKELSPFKNEVQSVKIDISKLGISENISESVLMMLFDEDLCRWKLNMNPVVMTSQPVREYLKGNGIVVKSYKKFKDFRFEINNFYSSLEGWKNTKFSANPKPESNKEAQLKALGEMVEKDKKEDELTEKILKKVDERMQKTKKTNSPEMYLNNLGDLWREPKAKYCYQMGEKSDRHQIVRYLASNKGYQQTSAISSALGDKSEQSIRTEIAKIRGNIKKFLNIEGKQVIEEGRKGSGYTIGSKYKIKIIS